MATVYTWPGNIPDSDIDADSPLTASLFADIRDGISNVAERLGTPGTYNANAEDHRHNGTDSHKVSAADVDGESEPRPQAVMIAGWQALGLAGEKALDLMDTTPEWAFMVGPSTGMDVYLGTPYMAALNCRNLSTQNMVASTAIYNWRELGLTVERSNAIAGDRIMLAMALADKDNGGAAIPFQNIVQYTGDGTLSRTVAHGLGTTPTCVLIIENTNNNRYLVGWTTDMGSGVSQYQNGSVITTAIYGVDGTNVTLGDGVGPLNTNVNSNGVSYTMIALADGSLGKEQFGILSWTGNGGGTRTISGLGFAPDVAIAIDIDGGVGTDFAIRTRYYYDNECTNIHTGTLTAGGPNMRDFHEDGIIVGTGLNVNTVKYNALCWRGVMRWA